MNDQAERFNIKLDELLQGNNPDMSGEDGELLQLAALLAQTDYSDQSRIRHTLRTRLLTRSKRVTTMNFWQSKRFLTSLAAALLLVMFLTVPPLRTLAQDVITQIGQILFVREETRAEILDGQIAPTIENTDFQPFGVESVEVLSQLTGFHPFVPAYLPEGYSMTSRFVPPTGENGEIVTDYTKEDDVLHISQVRYNPSWSQPEWAVGDAAPRQVSVRGVTGTYVEQAPIGARRVNGRFESYGVNILTWEEDGFRFIIQSASLNLDELMQVAESLQ